MFTKKHRSSTGRITSVSLQSDSSEATTTTATSAFAVANKNAIILPAQSSNTQRDEELRIATLLGDHMPLASPGNNSSRTGEPSSSSTSMSTDLLNQFMSLRLLLLRLPNGRSAEYNELLEVLQKRSNGYSKDNHRSGAELATLLAKDWKFLKFASSVGPGSLQQSAGRAAIPNKLPSPAPAKPKTPYISQPSAVNDSTKLTANNNASQFGKQQQFVFNQVFIK